MTFWGLKRSKYDMQLLFRLASYHLACFNMKKQHMLMLIVGEGICGSSYI